MSAFGSDAVPALLEALGSEDPVVRRHAADILCYIGHPHAEEAAGPLGEAALDTDPQVAIAALMALGELRGDTARQKVEDVRENGGSQVRAIADRLVGLEPQRSAARARRAD